MPKVVIVNGSPNPGSRLTGIVRYLERQLTKQGVYGGLIHVAALPAEDLILGRYDSAEIKQANALIESAEAVVVASPVYKASYTGLLKTYLDVLPQNAFAGKWISPVFIGGTIAHLLTVDFAFKPVAAALGARRYTSLAYAVDTQVTRSEEDGAIVFELHEELIARLDQTLSELFSELGVNVYA